MEKSQMMTFTTYGDKARGPVRPGKPLSLLETRDGPSLLQGWGSRSGKAGDSTETGGK